METSIESYSSNKIRAEMRGKKVSTKEMCELLKNEFEIKLNEQSFNNKISRGNFNAVFFFQCMYLLDVKFISIDIQKNKKEVA